MVLAKTGNILKKFNQSETLRKSRSLAWMLEVATSQLRRSYFKRRESGDTWTQRKTCNQERLELRPSTSAYHMPFWPLSLLLFGIETMASNFKFRKWLQHKWFYASSTQILIHSDWDNSFNVVVSKTRISHNVFYTWKKIWISHYV